MIEIINSNEHLKKEIEQGDVILNFTATWCGPCKMFAPVLEEFANTSGKKVLKIDIDNFKDIAREYNIQSIPTTFSISKGERSDSLNGFLPLDQLIETFK